jgi:hypothetical protein
MLIAVYDFFSIAASSRWFGAGTPRLKQGDEKAGEPLFSGSRLLFFKAKP